MVSNAVSPGNAGTVSIQRVEQLHRTRNSGCGRRIIRLCSMLSSSFRAWMFRLQRDTEAVTHPQCGAYNIGAAPFQRAALCVYRLQQAWIADFQVDAHFFSLVSHGPVLRVSLTVIKLFHTFKFLFWLIAPPCKSCACRPVISLSISAWCEIRA